MNWSGRQDSNLRPPGPKPGALPGCATPRLLRRDMFLFCECKGNAFSLYMQTFRQLFSFRQTCSPFVGDLLVRRIRVVCG